MTEGNLTDAACHLCGRHAWIWWNAQPWCRDDFLAAQADGNDEKAPPPSRG